MTRYNIAHVRQRGQDMIIVELEPRYGRSTPSEQNEFREYLQHNAFLSGLAGTVVTVWDAGRGRMGFLAPPQWRSFFSSMSLNTVRRNLNKVIVCD